MIYYSSNNTIFATETPIVDSDFVEIGKEEYESRFAQATKDISVDNTSENIGCLF